MRDLERTGRELWGMVIVGGVILGGIVLASMYKPLQSIFAWVFLIFAGVLLFCVAISMLLAVVAPVIRWIKRKG